jgi:hypothetical protein
MFCYLLFHVDRVQVKKKILPASRDAAELPRPKKTTTKNLPPASQPK